MALYCAIATRALKCLQWLKTLEENAMIKATSQSQASFYREFLMRRGDYSPLEFGVDLTREALVDLLVGDFNEYYKGLWTIDELVLHPREATHFCDEIRRKHGFFDLPDDIILRAILNRRKRPDA
jgi:hypothetical protein